MSAIEKEIDKLGRIVLPMSYRKKLSLKSYDKVSITLNDREIIITPLEKQCALCGEKITANTKLKLCKACISKIKAL